METASQQKQRVVAKTWCGDDFNVEDTPFFFSIKDKKGQYEIASSPWGYTKDLKAHMFNYLDNLEK